MQMLCPRLLRNQTIFARFTPGPSHLQLQPLEIDEVSFDKVTNDNEEILREVNEDRQILNFVGKDGLAMF